MHMRPFCLATAGKPTTELWYHEVAVPTTANVQAAFAYAAEFERREGDVDVTAFVDLSLRPMNRAWRRIPASATNPTSWLAPLLGDVIRSCGVG